MNFLAAFILGLAIYISVIVILRVAEATFSKGETDVSFQLIAACICWSIFYYLTL